MPRGSWSRLGGVRTSGFDVGALAIEPVTAGAGETAFLAIGWDIPGFEAGLVEASGLTEAGAMTGLLGETLTRARVTVGLASEVEERGAGGVGLGVGGRGGMGVVSGTTIVLAC